MHRSTCDCMHPRLHIRDDIMYVCFNSQAPACVVHACAHMNGTCARAYASPSCLQPLSSCLFPAHVLNSCCRKPLPRTWGFRHVLKDFSLHRNTLLIHTTIIHAYIHILNVQCLALFSRKGITSANLTLENAHTYTHIHTHTCIHTYTYTHTHEHKCHYRRRWHSCSYIHARLVKRLTRMVSRL